MDVDPLSNGEKVAGASAILLCVSMLFDWFVAEASPEGSLGYFPVSHDVWDALEYIPFVLLAAAAALAVAALPTKAVRKLPVLAYAVVSILGVVSATLILYRIVDPPGLGPDLPGGPFGPVMRVVTVQPPAFFALLGAAGVALGGFWAMRDERARGASS